MNTPFFTIIYPTRNRPQLLKYCLECMEMQTFKEFEVIVCDNHTGISAEHIFDSFAHDSRFKYITPPSPLPMHDNWEFASTYAKGEYVSVFTDKIVLRPSALEIAYETLKKYPAEIISWWNEGYYLTNEKVIEKSGYDRGNFTPKHTSLMQPYYFDTKILLKQKFEFDETWKKDFRFLRIGKICFGSYSKGLIQRIKKSNGRLFHPVAPDNTSMIAALALAKTAVDVGQSLQISIDTMISNGKNCNWYPDKAMEFFKEVDPSLEILKRYHFKNLYYCQHNMISADFLIVKESIGRKMENLIINIPNLLLRMRDDLNRVLWNDEIFKKEQYGIWWTYFNQLSIQNRFYIVAKIVKNVTKNIYGELKAKLRDKLQKHPILFQKILSLLNRVVVKSIEFSSVVEAAKYADEYYMNLRKAE